MNALSNLRKQLDQIDREIVGLIGRRLAVCREVAGVKRAGGIEMMQPQRIEYVKSRCAEMAVENGVDPGFIRELYGLIIAEACQLETQQMEAASPALAAPEPRGSKLAACARAIDHVAIAVRNLDEAIGTYRDMLGFELVERRLVQGAHSAMDSAVMQAGGVTFVLVQGTTPESNVTRYIEHYGPGVQHVALAVDAVEELHADLARRDCNLLTGVIEAPGLRQVFTRRERNSGMQLEFIQRTAGAGFDERNVQELYDAMDREDVY